MSKNFLTTTLSAGRALADKHERKATWVTLLTIVVTVAYRIYTDETGDAGKTALWRAHQADLQRIESLERQAAFNIGYNEGWLDATTRK